MRTTGVVGFIAVVVALAAAPGHAQKGVDVFSATLAGEHEVPLVSSPAQGTFRAEIDEAAETVRFELSYSGFSTAVRQSHIHIAQPFASGAIMVWLCDSAANPAPTPIDALVEPCPQGEGTVTGTITPAMVSASTPPAAASAGAQGIAQGEFAEFIAAIRSGNAYANVHSAQSGAGEIRGQLKPGNGPK